LAEVIIEGTLLGVGTLGKGTGIVRMIAATFTQGLLTRCPMQGNAGMTIGFENRSAMGTSNGLAVERLMTARTI